MHDPVKTVDGMTYDRPAIERWLMSNATSPLTNMSLASKALVPNPALRDQIASFIQKNAHLITPQSSSKSLLDGVGGGMGTAGPSSDAMGAAAALNALSVTE